jgi:hypothetical protein
VTRASSRHQKPRFVGISAKWRLVTQLLGLGQVVQDWLWQWHKPLLVAFADDAKQQIGAVDCADFQGCGFADAQTAGVHIRRMPA